MSTLYLISRGMPLSLPLKRLAAPHVCVISSAQASHQPGAPWLLGASQWHYTTCSTSLPPSLPLLSTSECNLPTCFHGKQTHPAHRSFLPSLQPKWSQSAQDAQTQTELQHAWPQYQRREGSTLLWAFCLAATTTKKTPRQVVFALLFFHLSSHCSLSSVGFVLQIFPEAVKTLSQWSKSER